MRAEGDIQDRSWPAVHIAIIYHMAKLQFDDLSEDIKALIVDQAGGF